MSKSNKNAVTVGELRREYEEAIAGLVKQALIELPLPEFIKLMDNMRLVFKDPRECDINVEEGVQ